MDIYFGTFRSFFTTFGSLNPESNFLGNWIDRLTFALEWRVMHESFVPNCNIFSVLSIFKCNPGKTNDKFIMFLIISIQWYRIDEFKRKRKRRIIVYSSVTRYGPRTSCKRKGLKIKSQAISETPIEFVRISKYCDFF